MRKLGENPKYSELRDWFKTLELPEELETDVKYRIRLNETVDFLIHNVDTEIERLGAENIKESDIAKVCKKTLLDIYNDLITFPEGWNCKRVNISDIKKTTR